MDIVIEKKMWHIKTTAVPVADGVLDAIKKGNRYKHIDRTRGRPNLYELRKIALSGTAQLIGRVLLIWLKNITKKRQQKS